MGVATAIHWVRAWRDEGRPTERPMGGDVRSHRIEAFGDVILSAVETQKDITLAKLADMLERDHGASFSTSAMWRLLDRHNVTFKKNDARQQAGAARRGSMVRGLAREPA